MTWQPIETAPKDRRIDLMSVYEMRTRLCFRYPDSYWRMASNQWNDGWVSTWFTDEERIIKFPTHWMEICLEQVVEDADPSISWQPIETAPKDRRIDLMSVVSKGKHRTYLRYPDSYWRKESSYWNEGWTSGWFDSEDGLTIDNPTHWMEIPEPPK